KELEQRAVELVGARLDRHVHLRPGVEPILGGVDGALHFELLDGLDGGREAHGIDARLGGHDAVDGDVLLDIALAVGRDLDGVAGDGRAALAAGADPARAVGDARHQGGELAEVASVERELDHALGFNHRADGSVFGAQQGGGADDLDRFDLLADWQAEVDAGFILKLEDNAADHFLLETGGRAGDFVLANVEQRKDVVAGLVGGGGAEVAGCHASRRHRSAGNHGPGGVGDEPQDFRGYSLGGEWQRNENKTQPQQVPHRDLPTVCSGE